MSKASTRMLEQGIQAPSPAPDLIPAERSTRTYIEIGTTNGGTSAGKPIRLLAIADFLMER